MSRHTSSKDIVEHVSTKAKEHRGSTSRSHSSKPDLIVAKKDHHSSQIADRHRPHVAPATPKDPPPIVIVIDKLRVEERVVVIHPQVKRPPNASTSKPSERVRPPSPITKVELYVPGVCCMNSEKIVKNQLKMVPGVQNVIVDQTKKKVVVTGSNLKTSSVLQGAQLENKGESILWAKRHTC